MKLSPTRIISVALALFAMLFGSGNIVFPLLLGRDFGPQAPYAMIGFFLTAVIVPLIGIIAMALFDGDYRVFLARIGRVPSMVFMALCFALIGPFCIIPRCIAVSYAAIAWFAPSISRVAFSLLAVLILYVCTVRQSRVVDLLGKFLGPVKLLLLCGVIIKGFFVPVNTITCVFPTWQIVVRGLLDGYGTLDLLAALFFSSLIIGMLQRDERGERLSHRDVLKGAMLSGGLGALILGTVYTGFVLVASWQSNACLEASSGQLLSSLAYVLLGTSGGILASITLAVACLTTAIALTTVFSNYLSAELFDPYCSYHTALLATLAITFLFANLGFEGIMAQVAPLILLCYPALIALSLSNILYKVSRIDLGSVPFYVVLGISIVWQFMA